MNAICRYTCTGIFVIVLSTSGIIALACTTQAQAPPPTPDPTVNIETTAEAMVRAPSPTATPALSPVIDVVPTPSPTSVPPTAPPALTAAPTPIPTHMPVPTNTPMPPMPRGVEDTAIEVTVYDPERAWPGTTLLSDRHDTDKPRIIEVNMLGEVIWQYVLPKDFQRHNTMGPDAEELSNKNILLVLPKQGVIEINRNGDVVWSHMDENITHDADRLPNGNTLYAFGDDTIEDAQVKEVNPEGELVWAWYAKEHFNRQPYMSMSDEHGWTTTNSVERLENGNTLLSLKNFGVVVEVDPNGSTVRTVGEGLLIKPHGPELLPNGNIRVVNHSKHHELIEFDPSNNEIVWRFLPPYNKLGMALGIGKEKSRKVMLPIRDADTLPNGNVLFTAYGIIFEVTRDGDIVWQLQFSDFHSALDGWKSTGFYKAERIGLDAP